MKKSFKNFDEKKPESIKLLQKKLNEFNALKDEQNGTETEPLEITGKLDGATKEAWLAFKKETFADSSLGIGFLKDKNGMNFSDGELKKLGFSADALSEKPKNPNSYDREKPSKALIKAVQEKLELEPTGKMDKATKDTIIAAKKDNWIDGRLNPGALEQLDGSIESMKEVLDLKHKSQEKAPKHQEEQQHQGEHQKTDAKGPPPAAAGTGSRSTRR